MSPSAALLVVALGAALAEAAHTLPAFIPRPSGASAHAGRLGCAEGRRGPSNNSRVAGGGDPATSVKCASGWCELDGKEQKEGVAFGPRRRRKQDFVAASSNMSRTAPLAHLRLAADENSGSDRPSSTSSPPLCRGRAFAAAACFRGGAGVYPPDKNEEEKDKDRDDHRRPVMAAAGKSIGVGVGKNRKHTRLVIDLVEDSFSYILKNLSVAGVPMFHLTRLGFGLSLLFYGMAFRTFAFHVIVFRITGFKQLKGALSALVSGYRTARQSVREAAEAAETLGESVINGDELKAARKNMIKEKRRLLSDGVLSEEETRYFMETYSSQLMQIKEEREQLQSTRSSVLSVWTSVNPEKARASIAGVYSALVTSFTASSVQTAGRITLALHVGSLLKTHVLDLFGPILDPIGYGLDLNTYYDRDKVPYMGKANAMGGAQNMALNVVCYSVVLAVFRVHPSTALKAAMVYYGARVVTDYVVWWTEPVRRKFGRRTIDHTPWSAVIHAGLAVLGYCYHRRVLHTAHMHPFAVGPGLVGLVEPCVRFFVAISEVLAQIEFFRCSFVEDPVDFVQDIASQF